MVGKHSAVARRVRELLRRYPEVPALLVYKGMALQLADDNGKDHLKEAREALKAAADLVLGVPYPVTEFAYFLYAVDDNSQKALKLFERARIDGLTIVEQAYIGSIKALIDLGQINRAKKTLKAATRTLGPTPKLSRLKDELDLSAATKKPVPSRG